MNGHQDSQPKRNHIPLTPDGIPLESPGTKNATGAAVRRSHLGVEGQPSARSPGKSRKSAGFRHPRVKSPNWVTHGFQGNGGREAECEAPPTPPPPRGRSLTCGLTGARLGSVSPGLARHADASGAGGATPGPEQGMPDHSHVFQHDTDEDLNEHLMPREEAIGGS